MGAIIKRGKKFYLQYFDSDGVRRMIAAKGATSRDHARGMLNAIERNVMEGKVGVPKPAPVDVEAERRRAITVQEIGDTFIKEFSAPRIKDVDDYRMEARSVLTVRVYPALADRAAASVTSLDVEALRDALAADYAPQSVNNALNTLSKLYGWARKQKLIDCDNPVRGVERHRSDDAEPIDSAKYLSREEAANLLVYADECARTFVVVPEVRAAHPMIATALYAGLRKGELYGLRWCDLNFDRAQITIARSYAGKTKSGKVRHVPIAPALAPILRAWRDHPQRDASDLVFPVDGRMGEAYETLALAAMMQAAGSHVPPKCWHGLRHSFASHFMMAGGNILALQKLLGHADITTTMIYSHLAPDFMAKEIARLDFSMVIAGVTPIGAAAGA